MNIHYYLRLKNVDRLGLEPKLRRYSLMEHSYMVTVLFMHFASKENILYDVGVLDLVMHHDILETVTGDLPYPIKNHNRRCRTAWAAIEEEVARTLPELKPYTDQTISDLIDHQQHTLLSVCDLLDLWIFCKEEQALGNGSPSIVEIINKCYTLILGHYKSVDKYMKDFKHHGQAILPR